jgi:holin-like protein
LVNVLRVIIHILFLFLLLFIGNGIQAILQIPIPGSVIGMILFFVLLKSGIVKLEWVLEGTSLLLRHLTLFFIPVTVGFIEYLELFQGKGIWLLIITIFSTALVMGLAGMTSERLAKRQQKEEQT